MTIEPAPELIEMAKTRVTEWTHINNAPSDVQLIAALLAALPEEVTNQKPELPSEPGWYLTPKALVPIHLHGGSWLWFSGVEISEPWRYAPFTRLVPEKPPVTARELSYFNASIAAFTPDRWQRIADYVNGDRA
jgi:hypothetical protein